MKSKLISLIIVVATIASLSFTTVFASMSDHSGTISYSANGHGYSTKDNKNESASKYSTKLTGVGFVGIPSGLFPNNDTKIYLVPVDGTYTPIAPRNYHTRTHMLNGTVKHDTYFSAYQGTVNNCRIKAYSNNTSLGCTVTASWNYGYKATL